MASFLGQSTMSGLIPQSPQDAMENAARLVDSNLLKDRNYLDLSDLLKVPTHTQPSVSGLQDYDYPSLSDPAVGLGSLQEFSTVKKVPLPTGLVEQFENMQCSCTMGLFREISRAWLAVDREIFIWRYEDGGDLAYFDGLSETILCAGLVRPKPGVFQPHIQYLLCLTTPVDIVLLGASFVRPHEALQTESGNMEMHLLPDPLFSIPTDNKSICCIEGTNQGRIFMGGRDGCIYELVYQAEDGWFSRKCRKINHSTSKLSYLLPSALFSFSFAEDDALVQISIDESRHILYTRSEKGTIQVFDLGEDGKGMSRIAAVSENTTVQNAALVARTIDRSNFKQIVYISALPKSESSNVHLLAVTHSGVRLYFTVNPFNNNRGRPNMLCLVHVRLPPGFSATGAPQRPNNVHKAFYRSGTLLLAASQANNSDLLWSVGPDSFPFQNQLMETHDSVAMGGYTWAISEIPSHQVLVSSSTRGSALPPRCEPPLVVTQHMQPDRRFVVVSPQGSYMLTKPRPVDQLRQLLLNSNGPDAEEVSSFFKLHKEEQACATCLILACATGTAADSQVSDWATRAFFLYGGEPEFGYGVQGGGGGGALPPTTIGPNLPHSSAGPMTSAASPTTTMYNPSTSFQFTTPGPGMQPNQMSTPVPGFAPTQLFPQSPGGGAGYSMMQAPLTYAQEVQFSGKHNGICLYLARILRPLWESLLVGEVPFHTPQGQMLYLSCNCNSEEISWFLEQLQGLKNFLDTNSQFTSPVIADSMSASFNMPPQRMMSSQMDDQMRRKQQADAQSHEKASLQFVQQMVHKACEVLGLLKIICDHQFHIIAAGLSKDQQNQLKTMTFRQLVVNGKEMCSALITCLVNCYLGDNAKTDAISKRLREVCPSLYSSEDALCSKANELLQSAKSVQNKFQSEKLLRESLQLYKQITQQLDLPVVCSQFANVRFFEGIVDLCLTAAAKRDPQSLASHYYKNGEPGEDLQGRQAFCARMDSYKCITETLGYLLNTSMSHPQSRSVPNMPGPPPTPDPNKLTNAEAEQYTEKVLRLSLKSDDEMFHVALYDWLISMELTEKLLEIQSPYLEPYLKRAASMQPYNLCMLDLLWKHYEKTRNYSAAARILSKLADRHSMEVSLHQRIEYLSRATMSAKSSTLRTSSASEGEFLHELEEKMEVARIQLQILERLERGNIQAPNIQECISRLNSELMDISTLFSDFADTLDLSECKLAIIHCAGHYDPTLVEALWQDIIDKELQETARMANDNRVLTLKNKLVALGRLYSKAERYFPIAFLVKYLEKRSCELNFDQSWVFQMMMEVGVSLSKLHEIYDRLFKSKDPCWLAARKPLHLLDVIYRLLNAFVDNNKQVPMYERRQFVTICLDSVASYLVELQSMGGMDRMVQVLMENFKALQAKLERLQ